MAIIMKYFNITTQVYKNNDTSKQNLLINQVMDGNNEQEALDKFKLHFPLIEYSIVKILSVEQISQDAA
jgi:hypothetical protein